MMKKGYLFLSYLLVAALASALTFGITEMLNPTTKVNAVEKLITECFIGESDTTVMEDAAAKAMIASLGDRWSYYIPASEYASYEEQMQNAYVGIGVTISALDQGGFLVQTVQKDSPAQEAGVQINDVIVSIEGQSTENMTVSDAREIIRGEEGTSVTITVLRGGEGISLYVQRKRIETPVASWELLPNDIGLVRIENFDTRCAQETIKGIESLLADGARMLIFDVRNNPGGYADELVKVLDYLLPEGELFRTVDYKGREKVDYSNADCLKIPMAVLVNADSYSAAEFFAAALKEYEAAVVVGEQTCGKGYFQNTFRMKDGSAVGLSVGKYFTPKGESLIGTGILPDLRILVEEETAYGIYLGTIPHEEDPQLTAAIDYLLAKQ